MRFQRDADLSYWSAQSLSEEGTLTPARSGLLDFRLRLTESRLTTSYKRVVFRLNCVTAVMLLLAVIIICDEIRQGMLGRAAVEILFFLAIGARFYFKRFLRSRKDNVQASPKMRAADFLLWLLLPREGREAAIGDTNETFEMMLERNDKPWKAHLFYWGEVARSAWPLFCYLGQRLGKWIGFGAIIEAIRRAI